MTYYEITVQEFYEMFKKFQFFHRTIRLAVEHMDHRIHNGISPEDAWNQTSIELAACAEAHCRAFIVKRYVESIKQISVSPQLHQVLLQLSEFYAIYWTLRKRGDFLQVGVVFFYEIKKRIFCIVFYGIF